MTTLILRVNEISIYPHQLKDIDSLTHLNLSRNRIQCLPSSILSPHSQLTFLDLSNNPYLPESYATKFVGMGELEAFNKEIEAFSTSQPPNPITQYSLDFSNSNMVKFPQEILLELKLNKNIVFLDISNNQLEYLPAVLASYPHLKIDYTGNPLSTVPTVFAKNWSKLRSFLENINHSITRWNRCKLMIVGQEGVGKVSIFPSFLVIPLSLSLSFIFPSLPFLTVTHLPFSSFSPFFLPPSFLSPPPFPFPSVLSD